MSIAFYDIAELEAETAPKPAPERRYRLEVVVDPRGRLVSAQAEPAAAGLIERLANALDTAPAPGRRLAG
jgi:hypothetical protein